MRRAGCGSPTPSGKAAFHARPHVEPAEQPDDDHPFTFNTGRLPHQWHTMTKTGKVERLNRLDDGPFVEIHPADSVPLGIAAGDLVEVASRRGRAVLPAVVTDRVQPGNLFAPIHWNDRHGEYASVNAVTNDAVDPVSFQPELKVCAVSLTKVATPASPGSGAPGAATGTLASLRGVRPPVLDEHERLYVGGFLTAVEAATSTFPGVPVLPPGAPVSSPVRMWVDGLLAGTFAGRGVAPAPAAVERTLAVVWASQTGNAEELAASVVAHLGASGMAARLLAMSDASVDALAGDTDVLVVTSTYGSGDPPDNGASFWRALVADDAPALDRVRYAVLALGDPSYADFCGHGRRVDERLAQLGATRLLPRLDCDPDFGPSAQRWLDQIVPALRRPPDPERRSTGAGQPFEACRHGQTPDPGDAAARPADREPAADRRRQRQGGPRDRHRHERVGADLRSRRLARRVADELPRPRRRVARRDRRRRRRGRRGRRGRRRCRSARRCATTSRSHGSRPALVRFLAHHVRDRELELLARSKDAAGAHPLRMGPPGGGRRREAPVVADVQEWVDVFTRLQPRQYSISSSPLVEPHRIRLTASIVRFPHDGRTRKGVCSTFLADGEPDAVVPVFVQRASHFRIPGHASAPAVMIGPGTGVAPFLGFLDERRARGHDGRNWLFFGEQRRASDHYYERELASFQADGTLTHLDLAFSRDQREKVYVQDRMREHGGRLWAWLQDGAHVYVCGDMTRMAADVDAALHDIVQTHGGMDPAAAAEYVSHLAADHRYSRDVY